MMGFRGLALALALVLMAPIARADDVSAADKETARNLMDEGRDLRDQKDLKGALQRFQSADSIMHVPTTGYEVATTQVALGMLVEARETLARIIASQPQPKEPVQFKEARQKAQTLDDSLNGRVPSIKLALQNLKRGATPKVAIDGVSIASTTIGLPRSVNPGHHVVVASTNTSEGRVEFDVREGEKKDVTLTLESSLAPGEEHEDVGPKTTPAEEGHHGSGGKVAAVVSFGIGGAALVAAGITGVLTFTTQSDLASKCPNNICGPAQWGEIDDANRFGLISTIGFAVAGVGVVVGVIALVASGGKSAPASAPQSAHAPRCTPYFGPGGAGLSGVF